MISMRDLFLSFIMAFIGFLMFEMPFINIEMILLNKTHIKDENQKNINFIQNINSHSKNKIKKIK